MVADVINSLNPPQREAVQAPDGPLLILAGPGSGKTRAITHRIAYLVRQRHVNPWHILAVTFTNKAAQEMKNRLFGMSEKDQSAPLLGWEVRNQGLTVTTFHAFGAKLLRMDGTAIGLDQSFTIYDDDDQIRLLKACLQELSLDPKRYPPRAAQSHISEAKSRLLTPGDASSLVCSHTEEVYNRVYERYQGRLQEAKAVDFDDLIMLPVLLFRQHPDIAAQYQGRYVHLLIDEFQDTNIAQYELAKLLAAKHRNICVVGDPDQSIFSWRFADLRNILSFERDYPEAKVVYLEQNYRSTKTILEAASHVISLNLERKPTQLWTANPEGVPIVAVEVYDEGEEAHFVVAEVERLMSQEHYKAGDCAVMYRTNAQSRALEETFLRYGMSYRLVGATRFYERREVKDALAYLRVIHNPADSVSLARIINVPGRGIGQRTVEELSLWAQNQGLSLYAAIQALERGDTPLPFQTRTKRALENFLHLMEDLRASSKELDAVSLLDLVLKKTGYKDYLLESEAEKEGEERWENVLELRTVAGEHRDLAPEEGLAAFLEGVALVSDVDDLDQRAEAVTLITLHQAKGLEFPVVFIVGMEEGLLPHIRSLDDPAQMEEERRLCYVGMTRARERLYLIRVFRRSFQGRSAPNPPSRFLADIPRHLMASPKTLPGLAEPEPKRPPPEPELKPGDRVRHSRFGDGMVVAVFPAGDDQEVTVAFQGAGVKRLLQSYAKLEKLG
ncbi:MAG: UvrD-helicase domain-containing protein [Chloroflexi bacterium]|nr:UvrD-helicase domain-containing protein [Chloroflexota bacterium]